MRLALSVLRGWRQLKAQESEPVNVFKEAGRAAALRLQMMDRGSGPGPCSGLVDPHNNNPALLWHVLCCSAAQAPSSGGGWSWGLGLGLLQGLPTPHRPACRWQRATANRHFPVQDCQLRFDAGVRT